MKYIKKFEKYDKDEQVEILDDLLRENPAFNTHDFYIFIGRPEFKEDEDGKYRKTIEIENMVKITPNLASLGAIEGMQMRARFNSDSTLYHIWLPKDLSDEVEGNSSDRMESWLVDLIDKHKKSGSDTQGKAVYKDVLQRRQDVDKYNM